MSHDGAYIFLKYCVMCHCYKNNFDGIDDASSNIKDDANAIAMAS